MLAYRCPKCGFRDFDAGPCALCETPMKAYEAGPPPKQPLRSGEVAPGSPPFRRHYSPVHGRFLDSWGAYHRANKEMGLVDTGQKSGRPQVEKLPEKSIGRIEVGDD